MSKINNKKKVDKTGWKHKNYFTFAITESGGVGEKLKVGMIEFFGTFDYHLLVEEGGDGHVGHYHLHAVVGSNYAELNNFRKKKIKPLYKRLKIDPGHNGCRGAQVYSLPGALSYVYKEKRVLSSASIMVNTIEPWKIKPKKIGRMSKFTRVRDSDFVETVVDYIDSKGRKPPTDYTSVKCILEEMMLDGYLFNITNKTRNHVGQILVVFGETNYALGTLDNMCNVFV